MLNSRVADCGFRLLVSHCSPLRLRTPVCEGASGGRPPEALRTSEAPHSTKQFRVDLLRSRYEALHASPTSQALHTFEVGCLERFVCLLGFLVEALHTSWASQALHTFEASICRAVSRRRAQVSFEALHTSGLLSSTAHCRGSLSEHFILDMLRSLRGTAHLKRVSQALHTFETSSY